MGSSKSIIPSVYTKKNDSHLSDLHCPPTLKNLVTQTVELKYLLLQLCFFTTLNVCKYLNPSSNFHFPS